MKLETFFEKFELFADAPNAVQKMRELVLDLAVKGKLTDRDSAQEAMESKYLLEPSSAVLPPNWRLLNFGKFCDIQGGNQPPKDQFSDKPKPGYVRMFQIRDLGEKPVPTYIPKESTNRFCSQGEILIGRYGASVGKIFWAQEGAYNVALVKFLYPVDALLPDFAFWVLKSDFFQSEIAGASRSAQAGFNKGDLASIDFPLPPLAEQKRIVAKVDELMALCDRLEAQQRQRTSQHTALARAAVSRFADAPTPANLDFIFHNAYAITPADLRKTILTLAVQGKLVPQNPSDENVDRLLDKNDTQRRETAAADRRADIENQSLLSAEDRWDIADAWVWRGLADLVLFVDYRGKTPAKLSSGIRLLTAKNVRKGQINLSPEEFLSEEEYASWMTRGFPKVGDVLFTTEAPMGNAAAVELIERFALAQRVICFQSYGAIDPEFLVTQILSEEFQFILDKNGTGVTAKGIKASKLKQLPIVVPPLAEQRRIVTKVDELMKLVDQLEQQLEESKALSERLLDAAVYEVLQAGITAKQLSPAIDRAAICCYALKRMQSNPSFARTAEVKMLYLAEAHLGLPLGGQWYRKAAGPLDEWIYDFERQADKEGWFKTSHERLSGGHNITRYQLQPAIQVKVDQAVTELGEKRQEFDRLLDSLKSLSTEDIEVIATLFAAWNDALIDGEQPSDSWIVREVRENWHPSKQRFSPEKLTIWLSWMRSHDLVPVGNGRRTVYQPGFELVD